VPVQRIPLAEVSTFNGAELELPRSARGFEGGFANADRGNIGNVPSAKREWAGPNVPGTAVGHVMTPR
jgi:hypothetical protein